MSDQVQAWLIQVRQEDPKWCSREMSGNRTVGFRCLRTGVEYDPAQCRVIRRGVVRIEVVELLG